MSQAIVTESKLVAIADAIRSVGSLSGSMTLDQMASAIISLSGGGGGGNNDLYDYAMGTLSVIDLSIPYVRGSAFQGWSTIKTVNLPDASYISYGAFSYCSSLEKVTAQSCLSLDWYAFTNCYSLTSAVFPNLTYMGSYAFSNCSNLSYLFCPELVTMKNQALRSAGIIIASFPKLKEAYITLCSRLTHISCPELETLSYGTFGGNPNLIEVFIPKVSYLSNHTLGQNTNLPRVSLPAIRYIRYQAFQDDNHLSIIDLTGVSQVPTLAGTNAFTNTPIYNSTYLGYFGSIYVPSSLYTAFTTATNWATFSARITSDPVPTT